MHMTRVDVVVDRVVELSMEQVCGDLTMAFTLNRNLNSDTSKCALYLAHL